MSIQGWWLEPLRRPQEARIQPSRFWGQVVLTLAVEAILALWIMGGIRPLSAL